MLLLQLSVALIACTLFILLLVAEHTVKTEYNKFYCTPANTVYIIERIKLDCEKTNSINNLNESRKSK